MPDATIQIQNLRKQYGSLTAVNDISLDIFYGEVFGLLGPNGAGKTTTVEILEGLRSADHGEVRIFNYKVPQEIETVKPKLGVQLQTTHLPELAKVEELIALFIQYYSSEKTVDSALEEVGLTESKKTAIKNLSGGQNQRLSLALALINNPELLILDEPTTGLDPQARRNIWNIVLDMKRKGTTILLTTHYMEEAEKLCDRVGIIDHGKIIALGRPVELVQKQNIATAIEFELESDEPLDENQFSDVKEIFRDGNLVTLFSQNPQKLLIELVRKLDQDNLQFRQISVRKASLEDVFLELTGRKLRD